MTSKFGALQAFATISLFSSICSRNQYPSFSFQRKNRGCSPVIQTPDEHHVARLDQLLPHLSPCGPEPRSSGKLKPFWMSWSLQCRLKNQALRAFVASGQCEWSRRGATRLCGKGHYRIRHQLFVRGFRGLVVALEAVNFGAN